MTASTFPLCFRSAADYAAWREAARFTIVRQQTGYCEDCTPSYQMEMLDTGRCNRPDIEFEPVKGGGWIVSAAKAEPVDLSPMERALRAKRAASAKHAAKPEVRTRRLAYYIAQNNKRRKPELAEKN